LLLQLIGIITVAVVICRCNNCFASQHINNAVFPTKSKLHTTKDETKSWSRKDSSRLTTTSLWL